jgi:hypothetical protein
MQGFDSSSPAIDPAMPLGLELPVEVKHARLVPLPLSLHRFVCLHRVCMLPVQFCLMAGLTRPADIPQSLLRIVPAKASVSMPSKAQSSGSAGAQYFHQGRHTWQHFMSTTIRSGGGEYGEGGAGSMEGGMVLHDSEKVDPLPHQACLLPLP